MPNGRTKIDCVYCVHFVGEQHEAAACGFHGAALPASELNRICCHFEASALLSQHGRSSSLFAPPARQFAWFGADLKPGVLYGFLYNEPPSIKKLAVLREPDFDTCGWKPPSAG
jgi:hypothetical protein